MYGLDGLYTGYKSWNWFLCLLALALLLLVLFLLFFVTCENNLKKLSISDNWVLAMVLSGILNLKVSSFFLLNIWFKMLNWLRGRDFWGWVSTWIDMWLLFSNRRSYMSGCAQVWRHQRGIRFSTYIICIFLNRRLTKWFSPPPWRSTIRRLSKTMIIVGLLLNKLAVVPQSLSFREEETWQVRKKPKVVFAISRSQMR